MKNWKCYFFHFRSLSPEKVYHPNHDAYKPLIAWKCDSCGYFILEKIKKIKWKLKYVHTGFFGGSVYEKLDNPYYEDPKIKDSTE